MPPTEHEVFDRRRLRLAGSDELFDAYRRTPDPRLRAELIERHLWLAERCADRYGFRGEPRDDLVQVARFGLVKAVDRYDPARGPFVVYATSTILGELRHHFRDATWSIATPRRAKELHGLVTTATQELRQRGNRAPTVDELAAYTGLPRDHIVETLGANRAYRTLSLDVPAQPDRPARAIGPTEEAVDSASQESRMISRDLIARLNERDRTIVYLSYFQGLTQREIGDRLGIGQVQVSRLLAAALAKLRRHALESNHQAA